MIRRRLVALALCFFGLLSIQSARAQTKLRVGVIESNESQLPLRVAINEGFFKRDNIEVELIQFRGGGIAVQAFAGGSIDLCDCATDHVVRLNNRGLNARLLVGIDRFNTNTLLAASKSPYTDLLSLKGQEIGVSAPGSYSDNTVRWAIKEAGLDPDRDFVILGVGAGATAKAALDTGQVKAILASTPAVLDYSFASPGKYKILVDWRRVDHSGQAIIGLQQWVDSNPKTAQAVVRAITDAERVIQTQTASSERAFKEMFPDKNEEYIATLASEIRAQLSIDGHISRTGFLQMLAIMKIVEPTFKLIKQDEVDLQPSLSNATGSTVQAH
jgi:NitT/TauT family transport system substrate-binding protein